MFLQATEPISSEDFHVPQTPPIHLLVLQIVVSLLAVPPAPWHVFKTFSASALHDGLLRDLDVSHQIQKRIPVRSFCVLTRDHHVRHLHQCPGVYFVDATGQLVLCIPQSASLNDIEYLDTSCTQVFANQLPS